MQHGPSHAVIYLCKYSIIVCTPNSVCSTCLGLTSPMTWSTTLALRAACCCPLLEQAAVAWSKMSCRRPARSRPWTLCMGQGCVMRLRWNSCGQV